MLSRLASSSDRQQGSSGETSPDQSSCSSDTGDVLIRSTRVLPLDRGHEGKPGPGSGSVHITVQKLRDPSVQPPLSEQQQRSSGSEKRQQRPKPRQKPENAPPLRVVGHGQSDGLRKPLLTKENREPRRRQRPAAESSPDRKLSAGTHSDQQPGDDLLTSRFAAGGRGVVLAALKQRSHSAPHRREVRVQLLDPEPLRTSSQDAPAPSTSSQDAVGVVGVQMEAGLSSACLRDATNAAAAAAAAAVAASAPLIKAQSDMEARVCHLAEGVQRLLQADRDGGDRGRSLSQQTLHHLETLHSQQLQQQSQLLESALRMMTGHAPATRDLTASGQTPRLQVTHLDTAADVLSNQQQSSSATRTAAAAVETGPVAMATPYHDRWPEQTRDDWYRRGAPSVSTATQPAAGSHPQSSTSHSQAAARRANETLREMGRLKAEMKMLLTPEDSLITIRPEPDHHQAQKNLLQSQESHSNPNHLQSQSQRSMSQTQQSHSQSEQSHSLSHQSRSQQNLLQSQQSHHHPNHLQSSQSQSQRSKSQENLLQSQQSKSHQNHLQSSQSQSQKSHSQLQKSQSQESHSQYQQSRSQQNYFESSAHQSHPQQSQSQESHSQYQQARSHQSRAPCQQTELQQNQSQFQQVQSQQSPTHQTQLSQQSQSVVVQRRPVVPSMLEEAGLVLRQVRRQKKVLEENLEALLRAKTGEVLNCQLEAMAANRDWTEEVRIKKTVDAWISTLTKDIQAEMSSEDAALTSQQQAAGSSAHTGRGRPVSAPKGTGSKTVAGRGSRGQTPGHRLLQGVEPDRATERLAESDRESYLTRLYGRAPYEGLRRTLKKSPYLRFSSPASPLGRKPRPRLVESVTGVKVKSCKTQTCLAPPITPSPARPQRHDIIRASRLTSGDPTDLSVTPADTFSVPIAIPLGRPRIDSSSRCLTERQQEVTSPPAALPESSVVAVDEGAPELQSQEEQQDAGEVPPSPPPPPADIIEKRSEEEENEEDVFPGTAFLSVADIVQQEEVSVVGEEALELDGGPSPPPVLYQGPVFPPQAPSALPAQDQGSIPGLNPQTDALENRLVEWVEQQLMSRMISEMYRLPLSDPAQNDSTDQSESREQSVTSDIVEAAGGGGLQLFVDSSISVDSALIRQLVSEVLTEHVALMLGQRDSIEPGPELEPEPGPGSHQEDKPVPLVPTPVPTPPPSPTPSSRETPLLTTPPPSEPTSLLNEESPRPITAPEPVATPTSSPEPAPSAGSPPAVHQAPPSLTWGNAELPLDEERPEEHLDTCPQPLVMSVAQEEPPLSSPSLPSIPPALSPSPPPPPPPPGPDPRPTSPSSSSEDSSTSSTSSTSTVTAGTEAALKHISEGELLISVNQLAAMTEEEAVCSFSSSLQELQDMDFDPPSEGQIRGHELLLNKMEQRVTHPPRGERPQPEGAWGRDQEEEEVSVGEVRDDWTTKPHRTTNPRSYSKSTAGQRDQTSPGQISHCADVSEGSLGATNQDSVAMGDLTMEPVGTLTSDLQTDLTLSPPPQLEDTHTAGQVVAVRPIHRQTAEQQQGGGGRVDVHLPSITPQEEEEEEVMEEVSAAADTESSSDDVF